MRFDTFTFSEIDERYGGEVTFTIDKVFIKIEDRYPCSFLIELVNGIADCWSKQKQLIRIEMLEEMSNIDFFLIDYPAGFLKIEIYKDAMWDCLDPADYTVPNPIFSGFFNYHEFAFLISQEIKRQGPSVFKDPKHPYPAEGLERLRRLMVGANQP